MMGNGFPKLDWDLASNVWANPLSKHTTERIKDLERQLAEAIRAIEILQAEALRCHRMEAKLHLLRQVLLAHGLQLPSDPPQSDPDANPHRGVVDQTIDALDKRLVSRTDRTRLRDAVDRADAPLGGKAGADQAVGRAIRFGR